MATRRPINCPGCGGEVTVVTAAAKVAKCPFCDLALAVKHDAVEPRGTMALPVQTPSCLRVGGTTRCQGREIDVVGRIQYRYDAGLWDEWWIRFAADDAMAWISQDEGEYTLERPLAPDVRVPDYDAVNPGDTVQFNGRTVWVEEKDVARMAGMQGELPLDASPEGRMRYLDLADDHFKATVEYFDDGTHQAFEGVYLGPGLLEANDADGPPAKRACVECGGDLPLRPGLDAATIVCPHCGCGLDVTDPGRVRLLFPVLVAGGKTPPPFPVALGSVGRFRGTPYTIVGRVRYEGRDDGGTFFWDEAELYHPEHGHAFLVLENCHWMLVTPVRLKVERDPRVLSPRRNIFFRKQMYRVVERSTAEIVHVEGELTWIARVGDRIGYLDAICPPRMLCAEWTDKEVEWFLGTYLTPAAVAKGFDIEVSALPQPQGVAPAQKLLRSPDHSIRMAASSLTGVVLLGLALAAPAAGPGTTVLKVVDIPSDAYLSERGYLSEPFTVPAGNHICRLSVDSSALNNTWVAVSVAFLDEQERVLLDADTQVELYRGRDDEGPWSEDSSSNYALVRLEGPAHYRLNVFGVAGNWSPTAGDLVLPAGPPINVAVSTDVRPARYFLIAGLLAMIYPVIEMFRHLAFEARRWSEIDD